MHRAGVEYAGFTDGVIFKRKLVAAEQVIVLLLVEELAQELSIVAVDDGDFFLVDIEVADQAKAVDVEAVPVAEQPHAITIAIAPDEGGGQVVGEGVEDVSSTYVAAMDDEGRASRLEDVDRGRNDICASIGVTNDTNHPCGPAPPCTKPSQSKERGL